MAKPTEGQPSLSVQKEAALAHLQYRFRPSGPLWQQEENIHPVMPKNPELSLHNGTTGDAITWKIVKNRDINSYIEFIGMDSKIKFSREINNKYPEGGPTQIAGAGINPKDVEISRTLEQFLNQVNGADPTLVFRDPKITLKEVKNPIETGKSQKSNELEQLNFIFSEPAYKPEYDDIDILTNPATLNAIMKNADLRREYGPTLVKLLTDGNDNNFKQQFRNTFGELGAEGITDVLLFEGGGKRDVKDPERSDINTILRKEPVVTEYILDHLSENPDLQKFVFGSPSHFFELAVAALRDSTDPNTTQKTERRFERFIKEYSAYKNATKPPKPLDVSIKFNQILAQYPSFTPEQNEAILHIIRNRDLVPPSELEFTLGQLFSGSYGYEQIKELAKKVIKGNDNGGGEVYNAIPVLKRKILENWLAKQDITKPSSFPAQ